MGLFGLFESKEQKEAKRIYNETLPLYEQGKYKEALKPMKEAAELGYKEAMYLCGVMEASFENHELIAAEWYAKASEKGHAKAGEALNDMCINPLIREQYHLEKELIKRAKNGSAEAQYAYAYIIYDKGIDKNDSSRVLLSEKERKQKDQEDALEWALKSAEQGNMDAQLLCAHIYTYIKKDESNAVKWHEAAIKHDHPLAYYKYGSHCLFRKQYEKASKLLLKAWDMEYRPWFRQQSARECIEAYKNMGTKESRAKALELCERRSKELSGTSDVSVSKYIAEIMLMTGQIYYEDGNKEKAIDWFMRSYNKGNNKYTALRCAKMYYEGDGIKQDYQKAYKLYSDLAKNDHETDALYQCGLMHFFGEGVPASQKKAFEYFSELAERGDNRGYYLCTAMYYVGIGVDQNEGRAYEILKHCGFFDKEQGKWLKECTKRGYFDWPILERKRIYL